MVQINDTEYKHTNICFKNNSNTLTGYNNFNSSFRQALKILSFCALIKLYVNSLNNLAFIKKKSKLFEEHFLKCQHFKLP